MTRGDITASVTSLIVAASREHTTATHIHQSISPTAVPTVLKKDDVNFRRSCSTAGRHVCAVMYRYRCDRAPPQASQVSRLTKSWLRPSDFEADHRTCVLLLPEAAVMRIHALSCLSLNSNGHGQIMNMMAMRCTHHHASRRITRFRKHIEHSMLQIPRQLHGDWIRTYVRLVAC